MHNNPHLKRRGDVSISIISIGDHDIRRYAYHTVSSTMDIAVGLAGEGCPPWTLVTACMQESGRGTHGRRWYSNSLDALYFSLVLPPPAEIGMLSDLSVRTAEALVELLEVEYQITASVKHPNDVLINGCKVAGILYESVTTGDVMTSLVLGMGVNVSQPVDEFKSADLPEAVSLAAAADAWIDGDTLLEQFLSRFIPLYETMIE